MQKRFASIRKICYHTHVETKHITKRSNTMSYDYNLTRDWDKIEAQHDFEEQLYDHQWQLCWSDIVDYPVHPAVEAHYLGYFNASYQHEPMDFETWLDDQTAGDIHDWCLEHFTLTQTP
jgi:hypothetical protein